MDRVVVEAPASSANLGPGFDVFALALKEPRDRVEVRTAGSGKTKVMMENVGAELPTIPRENAAGAVVLSIARKFKLGGEIHVKLTKRVPMGVGLGSSGASSAAAAVAMDTLFGLGIGMAELVRHAGEGERAASGAAHLDNVAASTAGGFVLVPAGAEPTPVRFPAPKSLAIAVATPKVKLPARKTEYARSLLPATVELNRVVHNVSMASVMVAGFATGDIQMIGSGMDDAIVEKARAKMIPGFAAVKKAAKEAGAAGVCMSGAGPSILSLVDGRKEDPTAVLGSVLDAFRSGSVAAEGFVTSVGEGARVVESS